MSVNIRNASFLESGNIDCEYEHPTYGWIPFSASKDDIEELGREIFNIAKEIAIPFSPTLETDAQKLEIERSFMICSPLQGKLILGEARWAEVEDYVASPDIPWSMKITIQTAQVWKRNSQDIQALQWILQLTDTEVDDLFRQAMAIR